MIVGQFNEEKLLADKSAISSSGSILDCSWAAAFLSLCDQGQTLAVKGTRVGARSRQRCRCGV